MPIVQYLPCLDWETDCEGLDEKRRSEKLFNFLSHLFVEIKKEKDRLPMNQRSY